MQECGDVQVPYLRPLWFLLWCVLSALGGVALARLELSQLQAAFETDARIAHRLLSQRVVQHDAVMATLALLQPAADASAQATPPEQRLPSVYPQILGVQRRDRGASWHDERLQVAETLSRALRRPVLAGADLAGGRYQLVLAAEPTSFAMQLDLRAVAPWSEWPMAPDTSPVRVTLAHQGQTFVLQPGRIQGGGWRFEFHKRLTAVLANTQAASRLLNDEPPELASARNAMTQAVEQARRASEVVGRLRRAVERPDSAAQRLPVVLEDAVRNALYLLEPEFKRREVVPQLDAAGGPTTVLAEPVALEQIIHNLLMNALQALEQVPTPERQLKVTLGAQGKLGLISIADSGPGIAPDVLPRIFEPFFTTREAGLGLGLSLCETLASGMGGSLTAAHNTPRGAVFRLALPLAITP